jgi:hypothetical protein
MREVNTQEYVNSNPYPQMRAKEKNAFYAEYISEFSAISLYKYIMHQK